MAHGELAVGTQIHATLWSLLVVASRLQSGEIRHLVMYVACACAQTAGTHGRASATDWFCAFAPPSPCVCGKRR